MAGQIVTDFVHELDGAGINLSPGPGAGAVGFHLSTAMHARERLGHLAAVGVFHAHKQDALGLGHEPGALKPIFSRITSGKASNNLLCSCKMRLCSRRSASMRAKRSVLTLLASAMLLSVSAIRATKAA